MHVPVNPQTTDSSSPSPVTRVYCPPLSSSKCIQPPVEISPLSQVPLNPSSPGTVPYKQKSVAVSLNPQTPTPLQPVAITRRIGRNSILPTAALRDPFLPPFPPIDLSSRLAPVTESSLCQLYRWPLQRDTVEIGTRISIPQWHCIPISTLFPPILLAPDFCCRMLQNSTVAVITVSHRRYFGGFYFSKAVSASHEPNLLEGLLRFVKRPDVRVGRVMAVDGLTAMLLRVYGAEGSSDGWSCG
ncbi:hypothetical protein EJ110_NYTH38728 [Nymphaea thermarum]|nr:hypothetical protein EJ110_NYTH38728 [Nymphaea thermarum]